MPPRKVVTGLLLAAGSLAGSVLVRRRAARKQRARRPLRARTARCTPSREGSPEADRLLPIAHDLLARRDPRRARARRCARRPTSRATSCSAPGRRSKYYLDKYRFETRPDLLGPLGDAIAAAVRRARARGGPARRPRARRRRARRRRLARERPAVPDRAQGGEGLRHREPARRRLRRRASASASSRTSSPPAAPRSRRSRRCARPDCVYRTAICVVDREEGGVDALARHAVRLRPLFPASELLGTQGPETPQIRMVERYPTTLLGFGQGLNPSTPTQEDVR